MVHGDDARESPAVPHLLVHCHHEAFGLPLFEPALSHLLCTPQFAPALRAAGATAGKDLLVGTVTRVTQTPVSVSLEELPDEEPRLVASPSSASARRGN